MTRSQKKRPIFSMGWWSLLLVSAGVAQPQQTAMWLGSPWS